MRTFWHSVNSESAGDLALKEHLATAPKNAT